MARLLIDTEEMIMALEDHGGPRYFLDVETGEIVWVADPPGREEDDLAERIEDDPQRYRHIDPIPSSESFNVMAEFVDSLDNPEAQRALARALRGSHPFRRFKEALLSFPAIREKWFRYHAEAFREFVRTWLEEEGIDADLSPLWFERKAQANPDLAS
ncbi:MAG TPA: UPF0158 family protein [Terriglobales bacterium]|jgi:hypothetical protein|nr:UPF0158 family protein [Terriglobales bacterium]